MSRFGMTLEGKAYEVTSEDAVSDDSYVYNTSLLGQVSLTATAAMLSDDDVFDLLDIAHAEDSLCRTFAHYHDKHSNWKDAIGQSPVTARAPPQDVLFEDVYVTGYVDTDYLQELCTRYDDGGSVLFSLAKFDTPIDNEAERVVRRIVRNKDSFDVDLL